MTQKLPKNKFLMWSLMTITVLLGGFSLITASWLYKLRGEAVSPFSPQSNPYAWDCSSYNFWIDTAGQVSVANNSTRNEPAQEAKVYINELLVTTLAVPALLPQETRVLGTVAVPSNQFSWRVEGTLDCSDSGSTLGCFLNFSIPTPTVTPRPTSTPSPTPRPTNTPTLTPRPATPTPIAASTCNVAFELPDTAVCWNSPIQNVPIKYTVNSLPTTGGPFYMQTDWYVASPTAGPHHYQSTQLIQAGNTYTMYADWPGIPAGSTQTVEIHAGLNVVNANGNLLTPNCTDGMDYYWTPFVNCSQTPPPPGGASPVTINPVADTYARDGLFYKNRNYGTNSDLIANLNPKHYTFLKFDLTPFVQKTISNATLGLRVTNSTTNTLRFYQTASGWTETGLTFANMPTPLSTITTSQGASGNTWKEVDITSFVNANKGRVVSIMIDTSSSDGASFSSKETSNKPYVTIR